MFFVKENCSACTNAKEKIGFFLKKWEMTDTIEIEEFDCSTEDGLIEAAMEGVGEIPTIVLQNDGTEIGRWEKKAPVSDELMELLGVET
jgi:hypothetical protein